MPSLERFIKDMQDKLPNLDFEGKRLTLEMLGITLWLDGENVEVTGVIELELYASRCRGNQNGDGNVAPIAFGFRVAANTPR